MHLTLFVPDLLWPDMEHAAAFDFPGAEHLARALSLAEYTQTPMGKTASWEGRLACLFGFHDTHPPLAALRSLGDGLAGTGTWLCADPVNLDFIQQSLVLSPTAADTLTDADVASLVESLNEEFADQGRFVIAANDGNACHWYFIPNNDASGLPDLAACSRLAGRRIDADETRELLGRDGLFWINRIQMSLNQHPVNQARDAAGLPLINSLWPWGLGTLQHAPPPHFASASGDAAILRGLCQSTQTALSQRLRFESLPGNHLITDLRLANAISHDDLSGWQTAISQCVTDWITPVLAALDDSKGKLQALTLISPDAHNERSWTLRRGNRGLRGNLLQRCLGFRPKTPALSTLVSTWSA